MINDILNAVYKTLSDNFNDTTIYNEITKQGFKTPCFCVNEKSVSDELFRGKRYKFKAEIEIRYYDNSGFGEVMEKLFECFESIEAENIGLIRGSGIKGENCGEYLKFDVEFEFYYVLNEKTDVMDSVNMKFMF